MRARGRWFPPGKEQVLADLPPKKEVDRMSRGGEVGRADGEDGEERACGCAFDWSWCLQSP